jgi:hypothetical protein
MENPSGSLSLPLFLELAVVVRCGELRRTTKYGNQLVREKDEVQAVRSERQWASESVRESRIGFLPRPSTALPYRFEPCTTYPKPNSVNLLRLEAVILIVTHAFWTLFGILWTL